MTVTRIIRTGYQNDSKLFNPVIALNRAMKGK